MSELPDTIPLFPLPNLVLFPDVELPLRIFEPRYREMVAAVADTHGIIGMMLLKGDWEPEYHGYPDVFEVGCAGRIARCVKLPDGRFNLVLNGLGEFKVVREIRERAFRQAQVQWLTTDPRTLEMESGTMTALRELLQEYVGPAADKAWHALVDQRGLRGAALVNFLSFHLDLTPLEKQTLLEAFHSRATRLLDVLTFKLEERKLGPGGQGGASGPVQ